MTMVYVYISYINLYDLIKIKVLINELLSIVMNKSDPIYAVMHQRSLILAYINHLNTKFHRFYIAIQKRDMLRSSYSSVGIEY